jgi:hypothetical protein
MAIFLWQLDSIHYIIICRYKNHLSFEHFGPGAVFIIKSNREEIMKRAALVLFLLLIFLFNTAVGQNLNNFKQRDLEKKQTYELKPKSPFWGAFYSVIPGIALHGSGLLYAEKYGQAAGMMGLEIVSVLAIGIGLVDNSKQYSAPPPLDPRPIDGPIESSNTSYMAIIGVALFAGTWIYDVVVTQKSISDYNELLQKPGFSMNLGSKEIQGRQTVTFGLSYRF